MRYINPRLILTLTLTLRREEQGEIKMEGKAKERVWDKESLSVMSIPLEMETFSHVMKCHLRRTNIAEPLYDIRRFDNLS